MKYKHFLLTRYNIGLYGRKQKMRSRKRINPEEWMANRWKLFEKYCVPSVENQTNKDFLWVVVFDPKTEAGWIDKAVGIVPENTVVITGENFRKTSIDVIESLLTDEDRVITSRMDNDDAIHKDFIKNVQEWFDIRKRTGVVSFPKGWVWNPEKNKLFHLRYTKNHFITFIEKRGPKPVKTVLRTRHTNITDNFQTFKVETDSYMWVEIIHAENMANYSRGNKVVVSKLKLKEYGL